MTGTALFVVLGSFLVLAGLHRASVAVFGRMNLPLACHAISFFLVIGGAAVVFGRLNENPLQFSAVLLYLSLCIVHAELTSLLSRGYSLRILYDLRATDDGVTLEAAKAGYGGGVGVRGLLQKRIRTLRGLGFLSFDDKTVGPLTFLGALAARLGRGMRAVLRLDNVG